MSNQKIIETVADIAYIAGEMKFTSGESRGDVNDFIYWAREFETIHKKTDWDTYKQDYIEAVTEFATSKLNEANKFIAYVQEERA